MVFVLVVTGLIISFTSWRIARRILRWRKVRDLVLQLPSDGLEPGTVSSARFQIRGWRKRVMKRLTQGILLRGFNNAELYVESCGGDARPTNGDHVVRVFYHSLPAGLPRAGSLSTGLGVPLTIDGGEIAGELCGNNVYIYERLLDRGPRCGVTAMAHLLLEARRQIVTHHDANRIALVNNGFVEMVLHEMPLAANETAPADAVVTTSREALGTSLAAAMNAERVLLRQEIQSIGQLGEEFDSLLRVDKVLDVQVTATGIIVHTDTIYCPDERTGHIHMIGKFEIDISLTDLGEIYFRNTTNPVRISGGMVNAPHVNAEGRPCLGNIGDLLPDLIEKRDFATAVQLAIVYLQTANTDDPWGSRVDQWPIVG